MTTVAAIALLISNLLATLFGITITAITTTIMMMKIMVLAFTSITIA